MATIQYLAVGSDHLGQRLDNFLISHLKGLPKSRLYRMIRKGELRVNKKRVRPDYRIQVEDNIRIPPIRLSQPTPKNAPSRKLAALFEKAVIFEDKNLLVINKPSGVAVHGGSGIGLGTIEILRQLNPQLKFLELAHRLDKNTSGCLLLAKKSRILKELHELLREGKIKKSYLALVEGRWPSSLKMIDKPLHKNQLKSGERIVRVSQQGKACLTQFAVLRHFSQSTLIETTPITGRTHQIRVHTQYAKHPIVGDDKYGDKITNKKFREFGCKHLFLHASQLSFILPSTGQKYHLKADLPEDLVKTLNNLTNKDTK